MTTHVDPDQFRVVDQWGRRFYHDPLPTCPIAPATDEQWPSVTTTKKAWDKPFRARLGERMVGLDALRAATFAVDHVGAWVDLPRDAALEMIATAPQRDLAAAGQRGTDIHRVIETLAAGGDPCLDVTPDAFPFLDTAARLVAELDPRPILAETVAVCRTLGGGGVAGTFDFYGTLAGFDGPVLVDWKTRSSAHAAYPEECAQLGAYSLADYVIVDTPTGPARALLPDVTALVVVSIAVDGYEVIPVDVPAAREAAEAMVAGWHLKMTGQRAARRAAGKPLPATAPDTEPPVANRWESPERRAWITDRVRALVEAGHGEALAARWPPGVPTLREDPAPPFSHINLIATACRTVEDAVGFPFGDRDPSHGPIQRPPAPAPASPLPEAGVGGPDTLPGDHPDVVALVDRLKALPEDLLAGIAATAREHSVGNLTMGQVTAEQAAMLRGWVAAVEATHQARKAHVDSIASDLRGVDDELWQAVCAAVGDVEPERWTDDHVDTLGAYAAAIDAGMVALAWTDDATPVLVPASDTEDRLVAVFGSKTAVRDAARPLADRMGAKARSVADIAADPALVAHLVAAGPPSAA